MTALAARVLAPALLEGDELGAAGLLDHLGRHLGAGDQRAAELGSARAAADHQNFGEFELAVLAPVELLDGEDVVLGDAVLLAACLDDSVHGFASFRALCALGLDRALWRRRSSADFTMS